MHDKLALKQMEPDRRAALRTALRQIRDWIAEKVPGSTEDVYSPEDILAFQFDDVEGQGSGGRQPAFWGRVGTTRRSTTVNRTQEQERTDEEGHNGGGGGGGGGRGRNKRKSRVVVAPVFRIASVPMGAGRRKVHVECAQDLDDAVLRMFVDENVDATCDRQTRNQAAPVLLSNVEVDGRPLDDDELVGQPGVVVGARLGSLKAEAGLVVETDCAVPSDAMRLLPGQNPSIRIEIVGGGDAAPEQGVFDGGESGDG